MKRTITDFFKKNNVADDASVSGEGGGEKGGEEQPTVDSGSEEEVADAPDRLESDGRETAGQKKKYHFQQKWLTEFTWLRYEQQKMFCIYCRQCGPTVAGRTNFVDGTNQFKLHSVKLHGDSVKHRTCRDRCIARRAQPLPTSFQRSEESNRSAEKAEMIIKFNTAYHIAKEELPFTKFKSEIILMKKNGLNVNPTYANDVACAQFVGIIGDTLKEKTALKLASTSYVSFMVDGSTDKSSKECEIIYARMIEDGKPVNLLVGHIEVEHAHAEGKGSHLFFHIAKNNFIENS